ncbi:hypothetical protein [Parapedobacter tibetensis]|nr:hypothetical protein [Parapedobacter tibetensis]
MKSSTTLLEFFAYFKDAYLMESLPQFSYFLALGNQLRPHSML